MSHVPRLPFTPLGISTSQIAFGCGTLVGRATLKQSAALVEAALDVGIRYFDTAPTYGMGTAEEVLGAVVGNMPDVVIATKVGYGRAEYSTRKNILRKYLKPIFDRSRAVKTFARAFYGARGAPRQRAYRPPVDFTAEKIRQSVEASLRSLRRDRLDVFLAHDPSQSSLSDETKAVFESLQKQGLVGCYGAAMSDSCDRTGDFGAVWQSAWPRDPMQPYVRPCIYVHHGVIRSAPKTRWGATQSKPGVLLRDAIGKAPEAIFIVATSTPKKLRSLVAQMSDSL